MWSITRRFGQLSSIVTDNNEMKTINHLPDKVLIKIFKFTRLPYMNLQRYQIVCKHWQSVLDKMWHDIRKLRFIVCPESDMEVTHSTNAIHLFGEDMLIFENVLSKIDGHLYQFEFDSTEDIIWAMAGSKNTIPTRVFNLFGQNEHLSSVKIATTNSDILENFTKRLSTKHLLHISISFLYCTPELEVAIAKVLGETQALEYLHINHITSSALEVVVKMDTLTSLHLQKLETSSQLHDLFMSIAKLPSLEALHIGNEKLIDDDFLVELGKSCRNLRAIQFPYCEAVTFIGWSAMWNLPNLRCVYLMSVSNKIQIFDYFSNLEELYVMLPQGYHVPRDTIWRFLHRSPDFKKFHFHNTNVHKLFYEIATELGCKLELRAGYPLYIHDWEKISKV